MLEIGPCELLKNLKNKQLWDFKLFDWLELFLVGLFYFIFFFLEPEMAWHLKEIDECDIQGMNIYFHLSSFGCSTQQRTFSSVISQLEFRNMEIKRGNFFFF